MYAYNTPLILKDPTGRFVMFLVPLAINFGIGAVVGVAAYTTVTLATRDSFSLGGKL